MIFCDGLVERQSQLRFSQQDASTCTTCVDRSQKTIHAFYHGNEEDPFWHAIIAAANQAGFNHRITFKTTLYPSFDATSMAEDIQQAVEDGDVDAMIVSTPSSEVREAVKAATDRGMAIFGMKSGYNDPRPQASSSNLGLAAMIGQDEFRSGQVAARRFLKARAVIRKAVFVNDEPGQEALDQRFNGFRETILESNPNAVIEHVQVGVWNAFANFSVERELQPILGTCDCDLVLSGGSWPAPHALEVVQRWNEQCSRTPNFNETLFGTFDATKDIIAGIETGDVLFAISQQPYLQATVPVLLASLYVVTGKKLADPSSPVVTGPVLLDSDSLRSEQFRYCADQGFVGNDCDERDTIYIAAVLDDYNFAGQSGDELLVAAVQASRDVGTSLAVYILDEEAMVQRIEDLCQQRAVDGLFVSLPSAKVAVSVKSCESLGVRAIVLETEAEHGLEFSKSVGSFQRDSDDTAAKYFQGYLPIALLTCKLFKISEAVARV